MLRLAFSRTVPHTLAPGAPLDAGAAALGAGRRLPAAAASGRLALPLRHGLLLLLVVVVLLGRHRVRERAAAAVVIVVRGSEPRGVDDEVARRGPAHGGDGGCEEHEPDDRRLDQRREIDAPARTLAAADTPRHLIYHPPARVRSGSSSGLGLRAAEPPPPPTIRAEPGPEPDPSPTDRPGSHRTLTAGAGRGGESALLSCRPLACGAPAAARLATWRAESTPGRANGGLGAPAEGSPEVRIEKGRRVSLLLFLFSSAYASMQGCRRSSRCWLLLGKITQIGRAHV